LASEHGDKGLTMSQPLSLQQMTERLAHLEQLMNVVRQEVMELRRQMAITSETQTIKTEAIMGYTWVDKGLQKHWINELFTILSIQGEPIGIETLQQRMSQAGLGENELSRDLIEARDE
jgi:hypothetical protein